MQPRVHLFVSFFKAHQANRNVPMSGPRDGLPDWLATAALLPLGFGMGSVKLNYPPQPGREGELMKIDTSDLRRGDVLLHGSRYCSDDHENEHRDECLDGCKVDHRDAPRKNMPLGHTSLELLTFRAWRLYFAKVTRLDMILQPWLREHLPALYQNRGDVQFSESERADYKMLSDQKVRGFGRTPVFLLHQPNLWADGPNFLGFFGMSGATTLAWAYLLQQRHSDLLLRPGFHLVELTTAPIPKRAPDLAWALEWKSEIVLSVPPAELGPK